MRTEWSTELILDKPIAEILSIMDDIVSRGGTCYLKWTCPGCGERVVANDANAYHTDGYQHEEKADGTPCGVLYTGQLFGLRAVFVHPAPAPN